MKKFLHTIIDYADKISTRPNETSWRWKGKVSPLACFTLYIIYLARLLSLLQHCKFWYRTIKRKHRKSFTVDKASKRINIPSMFVEIYFLCWCVLLFVLPKEWLLTRWMAFYFMGESIFWLLYYFFFRRFFEERYAIMHALEYIVLLPVLIIAQVKCISIVFGTSLYFSFTSLFFPSQLQHPYIIVLSVLYTALIFGIFLSNLPIEQVKERGNYRYNISIIGNGNIVQKRLKQAIAATDTQMQIAILDVQPYTTKYELIKRAHFHYFEINENTMKNVLASNILWIASPSYAHFEYLNQYINHIFTVIEKPLTINKMELEAIKQLRHNGMWNKVFCLSYYYLEKALPLTFLYNPYTFYEKYINFHNINRGDILSLFSKMGNLRTVSIVIHEGVDERAWTLEERYGGHLFETFIHLVVLARMVTGINSKWQTEKMSIQDSNGHSGTCINYHGTTDNLIDINLSMRKFVASEACKRYCELTYEHGSMYVDFDKQSLIAHDTDAKNSFQISV